MWGRKKEKKDQRHLYIVDGGDPEPLQRQKHRRHSSLKKSSHTLMNGPNFCMARAARLLYLSTLCYLEPNARGLIEQKYDQLCHGQVEFVWGKRGLDLKEVKEFYSKDGEQTIRCLCFLLKKKKLQVSDYSEFAICDQKENEQDGVSTGSNDDPNGVDQGISECKTHHILIAFRGTDTPKNVFEDIKLWTAAHPPERGSLLRRTRPTVHAGFLRSWRNDHLKENVINFVIQHVKEMDEWPTVEMTGHSLGGSVATLASYDIAAALSDLSHSSAQSNLESVSSKPTFDFPFPKSNLSLYTFGCPRVGNTPFAESINELVPDTWNVIQNNDIIPAVPAKRLTSPFHPFKRAGRIAIIRDDGKLVINPSRGARRRRNLMVLKLDTSLLAHHTKHYRNSLLHVFEREGLLEVKEGDTPQRNAKSLASLRLEAESLKLLGKTITEARSDPKRSFRLLPGAT